MRQASGGGGFHPHAPAPESWQARGATTMSTVMWLWIMYRGYYDGKALLVCYAYCYAQISFNGIISVTLFILASRVPEATAPDLPGGGRESSIPGTLIERCDRSTSSNWGTLIIFHADENIQ